MEKTTTPPDRGDLGGRRKRKTTHVTLSGGVSITFALNFSSCQKLAALAGFFVSLRLQAPSASACFHNQTMMNQDQEKKDMQIRLDG